MGFVALVLAQAAAAQLAVSAQARAPMEACRTSATGVPAVVASARIDSSRDVSFQAMAVPDTVYVGQQVQYQVAVFLNEAVRERLRRSPMFFPPDMRAMLAYDVPPNRGDPPRRQAGGRCFEALVYERAIFPLQAGRMVIPPAQLVYTLPLGPGIFSREETHELRTDSIVVVAVEPPAAGRPANDIGAVGDLRVGARIDTTQGRVGDPLTLTLRVTGEANVKLLPRPPVALAWASVIADGERVEVDSVAHRVRGSKEFDWLVMPRAGGTRTVPALEYPHFDPYAREYRVARTEPIVLEIESAPLARLDTPVVARLQLRAHYRGPLQAPLHAHPAVWLLAAAAPLPALVGAFRRRRREPAHRITPAARLATLASGPADARQVRSAFVSALAERLGMPAGVFTKAGAVERALRRSGVTRSLAAEAERFLRELDVVAYGGEAPEADPGAVARTAARLYAAVDAEALARWELGPASAFPVVLLLAGSLVAAAVAAPATDAADFRRGRAEYEAGRFASAAGEFGQLALREPRAPDAWANYGTASWESADTAAAVAGWQRALRLEPGARDMRTRLDAVRLEPVGGPGHVPPVGVTPLVLSALVLWLFACALAARPLRRGGLRRALAVTSAAAGIVLVGFAIVADERLAAGDGVVLRRGTMLSSMPAIGGTREARAETGEVGRAGARDGGWTHVRFDGDRAGWVPSAELIPIARATRHGG